MVLLFIQFNGFILYLICGRQLSSKKIFVWETKSKLGVKKAVQEQMRAIEDDGFQYKSTDLKIYRDLYYLHLRNNDAIFTQDNQVHLLTDGNEKFDTLLHDLQYGTNQNQRLY